MSKVGFDSPLLDKTYAAFLGGPVAINVASCDAKCMPSVARGYGCRISSDRRRVTVFLSVSQASPLLRDLRAGRPVAVVFTRPKTHQTIQLKGTDAKVAPLGRGDRAIMTAYAEAFAVEVGALGFTDCFSSAIVSGTSEAAVGVTFTPTAAFVQTPGPTAGQRLEPKP
ncbi:MAG: hypothetical protein ACOYXR_11580 [Nitrospirota bacterium]